MMMSCNLLARLKLQQTKPGSSRHLYVIRVKNKDRLLKYLKKNGISSQLHYPYSLKKAGALRGSVKKESLPISEKWSKECLSLPVYPYMKLSDAEKVVKTIKKYFNY
jgi:Predicted pyridoxal phosphate-dependent enzyme apparently involved in regulation of cell wall biogenesis